MLSPAVMTGFPSSNLEQSSPEEPAGSRCRALNFPEGDDINDFEIDLLEFELVKFRHQAKLPAKMTRQCKKAHGTFNFPCCSP